MKTKIHYFFMFLLIFTLEAFGQISKSLEIRSSPKQILIEKTRNGQELSLDFLIENKSESNWELVNIKLSVFDRNGNLIQQKAAWSGLEASLPGNFVVESKKTKILLNPFYAFHSSIELNILKFEFSFNEQKENGRKFSLETIVFPVLYLPKTKVILPVKGRIFVYSAHDFYAHHRRVDLALPILAQLGVSTNPTRYAYDFSIADENGAIYRTKGETNEDWIGFGMPIIALADGIVKEVRNSVDDNILGQKYV